MLHDNKKRSSIIMQPLFEQLCCMNPHNPVTHSFTLRYQNLSLRASTKPSLATRAAIICSATAPSVLRTAGAETRASTSEAARTSTRPIDGYLERGGRRSGRSSAGWAGRCRGSWPYRRFAVGRTTGSESGLAACSAVIGSFSAPSSSRTAVSKCGALAGEAFGTTTCSVCCDLLGACRCGGG
jgi:hypothetical protein